MRFAWLSMLLLAGLAAAQSSRIERARESARAGGRQFAANTAVALPLFEFAPTSGTGMTAACACTAPTGTQGETLTFTRASTGWCTKGNETTGIVAGDLVECASGAPRVMPGGDGTGGLGISIRSARTNSALRSAELDNVAWASNASGAAGPTVTANAAVAPDGTTTADRFQFPLTTIGQWSNRRQVGGCPTNANISAAAYAKMVSGSEVFNLGVNDAAGYYVTATTLNASTWTMVSRENGNGASGTHQIIFGNMGIDTPTSATLGIVARNALDVYVWQADCQVGTTFSPPITTVGTAVTRVQETASFPVAATGNNRCWGTSVVSTSIAQGDGSTLLWSGTTADGIGIISNGNKARCIANVASVGTTVTSTASFNLSATNRIVCKYDGTDMTVCLNGTCETTAKTVTLPAMTTLWIGTLHDGTLTYPGTYKKVVVDDSEEGCGS